MHAPLDQVLLELSMLKQGEEAMQLITQCIDKLERSLEIFPDNHNGAKPCSMALSPMRHSIPPSTDFSLPSRRVT